MAVSIALGACSIALGACGNDRAAVAPQPEPPGQGPDDKAFKFGTEVVITDSEILPSQLVTTLDKGFSFRNSSSRELVVEFVNGAIDESGKMQSSVIPPGSAVSFKVSTPRSIVYRLAQDPSRRGAIQVDPGIKTL